MNWKIVAVVVAIVVLLGLWLNFFVPKKEIAVLNFRFAESVDEKLNFVSSEGDFFAGQTMFFILELQGFEVQKGNIAYRIDGKITNISSGKPEETFSGTIIEETKTIDNVLGKINVVGEFNLAYTGKKGANILRLEITDKFSGAKKVFQKDFRVLEAPNLNIGNDVLVIE